AGENEDPTIAHRHHRQPRQSRLVGKVAGRAARKRKVSKTMHDIWTFHSAGAVIFGPGSIARLGEQAMRHRFARVLVVTDPALVAVGLAERVRAPLEAA